MRHVTEFIQQAIDEGYMTISEDKVALYGLRNAKCAFCRHSIGGVNGGLVCIELHRETDPSDFCELFEREPGSDA